ncbi:MAG TPA: hypothetical protein VGH64_09910 [Puia sp.]
MKTDKKKTKQVNSGKKAADIETKKGHSVNRSMNEGSNSQEPTGKKSSSQKENPNSQEANEKGFGEDE